MDSDHGLSTNTSFLLTKWNALMCTSKQNQATPGKKSHDLGTVH